MGKVSLIKERSKENIPFAYRITGDVTCVEADSTVYEAAKVLTEHNIGVVIVKSKSGMVGILSERDIVQRLIVKGRSAKTTKVKDIMTNHVITVDLDEGIDQIYRWMKEIPCRHLPVRKGMDIVGMVSNRDLMYLRKLKVSYEKKEQEDSKE